MACANRWLRGPLTLVLCVASVSCTPAWKEAFERGEAAQLRGDDVDAAAQFRAACRLGAPKDSGACERADALAGDAAKRALRRSGDACTAGDLDVCLAGLSPVRDVLTDKSPEMPEVERLLDAAGAAHVARCNAARLAGLDDAMLRARCVTHRQVNVDLPSHDARVRAARAEIGSALLLWGDRLEGSGHFGSSAVHASLATCVAGDPSAQAAARLTRERFGDQHAIAVSVAVKGLSRDAAARLCDGLAQRSALRCASSPRDAGAWIAGGALVVSNLRHTQQRFERTVEYVAGVDRQENPEYGRLQRSIERDRRNLRDFETNARVANADCETARSVLARAGSCQNCPERTQEQAYCNRADALTDTYNNAVRDLNAQIDILNNTPKVLEIERRATHSYVETLHRWELPWELSLTDAPGIGDAIVTEGVDRPSFRPAGIEGSAAREPEVRALIGVVEERANARIEQALVERLGAHARKLMRECDALVGALQTDCELRALWYGGRDPVSTWLQQRSAQLDQKTRHAPAPCAQPAP